MLEEIVIETAIGLLVMYMAYRTGWKGEAGLLHRYHTQNAMPEKLPAFARRMGQGLMAVGAGCTAMPYVNLLCGAGLAQGSGGCKRDKHRAEAWRFLLFTQCMRYRLRGMHTLDRGRRCDACCDLQPKIGKK